MKPITREAPDGAAASWTAPDLWRFRYANRRFKSARGLAQSKTWRHVAAFLLFGVLIVPLASAQEAVDNVVIVLDGSGSMAGRLPGSNMDKMTAAKAALKQVLK